MIPYLPHESTRSRGNVGGPEGDAVDKSQVGVGGTLGKGWRGRRRRNERIGLSRGASLTLGQHARQRQPTAVPVAQIVRKSARMREEPWKCTHLRQVVHRRESLPTSR